MNRRLEENREMKEFNKEALIQKDDIKFHRLAELKKIDDDRRSNISK